MESFLVRQLREQDVDAIISAAGGQRAHPDAHRRDRVGADYLLGKAVIELKLLDEEGLMKPDRQRKLAALFRKRLDDRPVIVIDREILPDSDKREFDRIVEGPVKTAVASARKQLSQSRSEFKDVSTTILFLINNGYTALDHVRLLSLVWQRARNDTSQIDGVVVAGSYFHSDDFDSFFLWPIDYRPTHLDRPFPSFEMLREAWSAFANKFMTEVMQGKLELESRKFAVSDLCFECNNVTYVKPAPCLGGASAFFGNGRPRSGGLGFEGCPPVAKTFPDVTRESWQTYRTAVPGDIALGDSYDQWLVERARVAASSHALLPFVPISVSYDEWRVWQSQRKENDECGIARFANELFEQRVRSLIVGARERTAHSLRPARYILAVTEVIGQHRRNDVSHILDVRENAERPPAVRLLVENARMFHEHALALAAAYGVLGNAECVLWQKDRRYAWE